MQAAGVLAALASAEHSSAARLLEGRLDNLAQAAADLAVACGSDSAANGSTQACLASSGCIASTLCLADFCQIDFWGGAGWGCKECSH